MPHHRHLHLRRPEKRQFGSFSEFSEDVKSFANELNPFSNQVQQKANGPSTVYKTVFTTLAPTFSGEVAGWSTVQSEAQPTAETTAKVGQPLLADSSVLPIASSTPSPKAATTTAAPTVQSAVTSELPSSFVPPSQSAGTDLVIASSSPTPKALSTPTGTLQQATYATGYTIATASSTAAAAASSGDSSTASKAGIAIGVLGGLLVVGLLVWFIFSKRKKQMEQQRVEDDEKVNGPVFGRPPSVLTTRSAATAPQLHLRPVTQFMPNLTERRSSKGAHLALGTAAPATRAPGSSPWERSRANDVHNPFSDNAERVQTPTAEAARAAPVNPFTAPENTVGLATTTDSPPRSTPASGGDAGVVAGAAIAAGAGIAAAGAITRKPSTRKDAPKALDLTLPKPPMAAVPPSPAGTEFSVSSVAPGQSPGPSASSAAIAAAGGPAGSAVHRVQLDFKPTLDDEMGLTAGQLVRLLHEYDDGWALCIRLDRSQQGVVPRTCLSTRPVKPRPQNGPGGPRPGPPVNPQRGPGPKYPPGQRPMTPQGGPMHPRPESPMRPMTAGGRPQSLAGQRRPQSPAIGGPMGPQGRPMSPGPRPQSPGPRSQSPGPRPQSPNGANRRHSPPGPSPMNPQQYRGPPQGPVGRKPVPGQAY